MRGSLGRGNIWGTKGLVGGRMNLTCGTEKQVSDAQAMAISNFAVNAAEYPWDQEMP